MIRATVYSVETRENSGTAKLTGKPYFMVMQNAYVHLFDKKGNAEPVPTKIELILDLDPQSKMPKVYPVGEYELHPSSFYMGRFGLEVSPRLTPIARKA